MDELMSENEEEYKEDPEINMDIVRKNPPTQDELMAIREAKVVIQSNLFHMQIDELLKEIKPEKRLLPVIEEYMKEIMALICSIKYPTYTDVHDVTGSYDDTLKYLNNSNCSAMKRKLKDRNHQATVAPISVQIVGSHALYCHLKNEINIDLVVKLRKALFTKNDYRKVWYAQRKQFYTLFLADKLKQTRFIQSTGSLIKMVCTRCPDQVGLVIRSNNVANMKCDIHVRLIPEKNTFRLKKIYNLSQNFCSFFPSVLIIDSDEKKRIIAHYTALLGQDLVTLSNEALCSNILRAKNMRRAFMLFKVWMHKRNLNQGYGCVNNFLVRMFMVYLYSIKRINDSMSSYQIVRNMWQAFSESKWTTKGISLAEVTGNIAEIKPPLDYFHSYYDVVFVDISGYVNLAAFVHPLNYLQLKHQSIRAIEILKHSSVASFNSLFMVPVKPLYQFDSIICFYELDSIAEVIANNDWISLEYCTNVVPQFLATVLPVIEKGVSGRLENGFVEILPRTLEWNIHDPRPKYEKIIVSMKLHPEHAFRIIDKGPLANFPEAETFRSFWGDKAELRRFQDGTVCESALWAENGSLMSELRCIVHKIIQKLLQSKFEITTDMYTYISNQMEPVLSNKLAVAANIKYGTGEEATISVLEAFNKLSTVLYAMDDLPLDIISIQGVSAVFRHADPMPALPFYLTDRRPSSTSSLNNNNNNKKEHNIISMKKICSYIAPNEVVIKFTSSGKWPDNQEAIKRVKAAMYVSLAEKLEEKHNAICEVTVDYLDVLQDGYVFRLKIFCPTEINVAKMQLKPDGIVEYTHNKESREMEKMFVHLPQLTSNLRGLHQKYPAYGPTCALAKRWLHNRLIDYHYLSEICIDLLVASLFLSPDPYETVIQPQVMFLRVLKLLAYTNWPNESVVVNFDNGLREEEISELQSRLNKRSETIGLIIITPFDKIGTMWTMKNPSLAVLNYISKFAASALKYVETNLLSNEHLFDHRIIFERHIQYFDILIYLEKKIDTCKYFVSKPPKKDTNMYDLRIADEMPTIGFNPIRDYLNELRDSFDDICLFFHNFYGGDVIGVLIKPDALKTKDIKVKNFNGCSEFLANEKKLSTSVDVLMNHFKIIGKNIVKECKRNK